MWSDQHKFTWLNLDYFSVHFPLRDAYAILHRTCCFICLYKDLWFGLIIEQSIFLSPYPKNNEKSHNYRVYGRIVENELCAKLSVLSSLMENVVISFSDWLSCSRPYDLFIAVFLRVRGTALILLRYRAALLPSDLQAVKINCIIKCLPFHQSGSQAGRFRGHEITRREETFIYSKQNEITPGRVTDFNSNTRYLRCHRVYKIMTLKQMKAMRTVNRGESAV